MSFNRTITTAAERANLKPGTVGIDPLNNVWKRGEGSWVSTGDGPALLDDQDLTLTIIWESRI